MLPESIDMLGNSIANFPTIFTCCNHTLPKVIVDKKCIFVTQSISCQKYLSSSHPIMRIPMSNTQHLRNASHASNCPSRTLASNHYTSFLFQHPHSLHKLLWFNRHTTLLGQLLDDIVPSRSTTSSRHFIQ